MSKVNYRGSLLSNVEFDEGLGGMAPGVRRMLDSNDASNDTEGQVAQLKGATNVFWFAGVSL